MFDELCSLFLFGEQKRWGRFGVVMVGVGLGLASPPLLADPLVKQRISRVSSRPALPKKADAGIQQATDLWKPLLRTVKSRSSAQRSLNQRASNTHDTRRKQRYQPQARAVPSAKGGKKPLRPNTRGGENRELLVVDAPLPTPRNAPERTPQRKRHHAIRVQQPQHRGASPQRVVLLVRKRTLGRYMWYRELIGTVTIFPDGKVFCRARGSQHKRFLCTAVSLITQQGFLYRSINKTKNRRLRQRIPTTSPVFPSALRRYLERRLACEVELRSSR